MNSISTTDMSDKLNKKLDNHLKNRISLMLNYIQQLL